MHTRHPVFAVFLVVALLQVAASPHARDVDRLAQYRDAFVDHDHDSGEWTIGNDALRYTVVAIPGGAAGGVALTIAGTSDPITTGETPDALITIDGAALRLGAVESGFAVVAVAPSIGTHFVALAVRLVATTRGLAATRRYVMYPGAGAVEMWTEIETLDDESHTVQNLNAYALSIPHGAIDYVLGLDVAAADGGSFAARQRSLSPGERLALGSPTLASESVVPYVSVGNGHRRVFSGLLWSGAWSASLQREGETLHVSMGLPPMSAEAHPGHPVEGPHAFVGAAWDVPGADIAAVTRFVRAGRAGRVFPAWTTFNTWFVHGIEIDEETIRRDIDAAAAIGVELVQLDAGWYPRDKPRSRFDFTDGLGSWAVDATRFPSGLASLGDYARERGVKFGLWVEPERVALSTVGGAGLAEERFLAQQDGAYQPGVPSDEARDAQVCLADPAARAWVARRVTQMIADVRPDNLKWDFNRWVHCTRRGHHHTPDGGNYEHTRGLYEVLAALRSRFPELTIENVAGGGRRMDFAMARLTDTAWMDDRTAPSAHVRRNLQGLLRVFPAPYLFSYVMAHLDEPIHGAPDVPLLVRSRMPGVVGVAAALAQLSERELNELHQQMELAKALRPLQAGAVTHVLTSQRPGPGEWEVVQQVIPDSRVSLVFAFSNGAPDPIVVSLRGIQPDVTYQLRSLDRGALGRLRGAELIAGGFEIMEAPESAAQVLVLEPISDPVRRPPDPIR